MSHWDILPNEEASFAQLAEQIAQAEFGTIDHFLTEEECDQLIERLTDLEGNGLLKKAGIGTQSQYQIDQSVRGDYIRWIETQQPNEFTRFLVEKVQRLMQFLNCYLFLGLRDIEMHFAMYPPGAGYQRHLDQLQHNNHRILSMVLYLNKNWEPAHGGELRIFLPEKQQGEEGNKGNGDKKMSEKWVDIAPVAGRLVCFRSDTVEHEVLTAFQPRKSVTGWMLDQPLGLGFL